MEISSKQETTFDSGQVTVGKSNMIIYSSSAVDVFPQSSTAVHVLVKYRGLNGQPIPSWFTSLKEIINSGSQSSSTIGISASGISSKQDTSLSGNRPKTGA